MYSKSSGRTLFLDPAASVVFNVLSSEPCSLDGLIKALAGRWGVSEAEINPDSVAAVLKLLLERDIVERVPA